LGTFAAEDIGRARAQARDIFACAGKAIILALARAAWSHFCAALNVATARAEAGFVRNRARL